MATPAEVEALREWAAANPIHAVTDLTHFAWSIVTGHCGYCGDPDCHPDRLCTETRECERCGGAA
jgi:hypothetical protein